MKTLRKLTVLFGLLGAAGGAAEDRLDFATIDSREKAAALAAQGKLHKILLFPAELGGEDAPPNIAYVPPGIPEAQQVIIGTLVRFAEDGLIDDLKVEPEYKGKSFVPSRIRMYTSHSGKPGQFNPTLEIW